MKISIVIPLYNKEKQIAHTLESVFRQTFQDFEVVIVNDGSTDQSAAIVKSLDDNRIRLIEQENQGVSAARNAGINEAKHEYIALLDADDEWKPAYLETQVDLIRSYPECAVFATAYEFKEGDKVTPLVLRKMPFNTETGILSNYFEVASCSHPPICSINIVAKKEAFLSVGGFPEGIKSGEDLLTWARLAVKYKIAYSLKKTAFYVLKEGHGLGGTPQNIPYPDLIAPRLISLYNEVPQNKALKKYIGFWFKIRANLFLRAGEHKKFMEAYINSLRFYPGNYKTWSYLLLLFIPLKYRNDMFKAFTQLLDRK